MGGFKDLQADFKVLLNGLTPHNYNPSQAGIDQRAIEYLTLRCLFEIAGNLDTIAVQMREQTEIMKKKDGFPREEMLKILQDFSNFAKSRLDPTLLPRYKKHGFTGDARGPCETCLLPLYDAVHK